MGCADLDTTFVSLKSVYLNPKSNTCTHWIHLEICFNEWFSSKLSETHVLRAGFWDRQGANIESCYKEMYGEELFLR